MWAPHACAHVVNISWFWDRDHFFLTSARAHLLSQGHIRHIALFLALLYGFSWRCQCCLSDPKPAAWQNTLPSTTCSLNTPIPPNAPLKNNYHSAKMADDESTFSGLLCSSLTSAHGQRTRGPTGGKTGYCTLQRGLLHSATSERQQQRQTKPPLT